jgi:hypothetical protein
MNAIPAYAKFLNAAAGFSTSSSIEAAFTEVKAAIGTDATNVASVEFKSLPIEWEGLAEVSGLAVGGLGGDPAARGIYIPQWYTHMGASTLRSVIGHEFGHLVLSGCMNVFEVGTPEFNSIEIRCDSFGQEIGGWTQDDRDRVFVEVVLAKGLMAEAKKDPALCFGELEMMVKGKIKGKAMKFAKQMPAIDGGRSTVQGLVSHLIDFIDSDWF